MANRIVGNVYIIDTASGNTAIPWLRGSKVKGVAFWSSNTAGIFELSGIDTTDILVKIQNPVPGGSGSGAETHEMIFGDGVYFGEDIKVPTVTAGTAWIYLA